MPYFHHFMAESSVNNSSSSSSNSSSKCCNNQTKNCNGKILTAKHLVPWASMLLCTHLGPLNHNPSHTMFISSTSGVTEDPAWSAVWPDLVKFRHFGKILLVFGNFLKIYLIFEKIVNLVWQLFYAIWQKVIVEKAEFWNNYLAIWSHCWSATNDKNARNSNSVIQGIKSPSYPLKYSFLQLPTFRIGHGAL